MQQYPKQISIHALHAECDPVADFPKITVFGISIHALHAECDMKRKVK